MVNFDQYTSQFNQSGTGSFDALEQLKQLQSQLAGGMQGATAQTPIQSGPAGGQMAPQAQNYAGPQAQSLGPWYSQQNPYLSANRAPGTAQQIGAGGQLYDWEAPNAQQRDLMNQWNLGKINAPGMNFEQWYLGSGGPASQMPTMTPGMEWQQVLQQRGLQDPMRGIGRAGGGGPTGYTGDAINGAGNGPLPGDLLRYFLGGGQPLGPDNSQMFNMPGTFALPGASGIGGANPWGGGGGGMGPAPAAGPSWKPGDNALNFIQQLGGQIPDFLSTLNQGQAVGAPGDIGASLQGLGQFGGGGGVPSPQSLSNLQPSEMQFLQGFFETLLGIPMQDVLGASFQPFQGLGRGRTARTAPRRRR